MNQEFTNKTVNPSPVNHIFVPYDRVDIVHETPETDPSHIQASTSIPSCENCITYLDLVLQLT